MNQSTWQISGLVHYNHRTTSLLVDGCRARSGHSRTAALLLVGFCDAAEGNLFSCAKPLKFFKIRVHIYWPERHPKFVHFSCLSHVFCISKKVASAAVYLTWPSLRHYIYLLLIVLINLISISKLYLFDRPMEHLH
jgi:hypothetical protein